MRCIDLKRFQVVLWTVCCIFAPLKSDAADRSEITARALLGESFLTNLFDARLNLLPEYAGSATYWLYHDNYLAAHLLEQTRPDLSRRIRSAISQFGVTNSGKIESVFFEASQPLPFRTYVLTNVAVIENKTIRTEIVSTNLLAGWDHYADLLFLSSIARARSEPAQARNDFDRAARLWDGEGFNDPATKQIGVYSTYKLALYVIAAARLNLSPPQKNDVMTRLLSMQSNEGGWITDYKTNNKPVGFANVETTCLSLLAVKESGSNVKAFPSAEGFGANAVGGRGGRVIEVTNLNDSGEGSLRAAMEASGPRICVFRVSGTITLKSAIKVTTPYLTVAGQTSPGGVQIKGHGAPEGDWGVWFINGAHDIVVRHLRVRMGSDLKHDAGNNLLCYGTAEPGVHDVIFDHCSVSWGSDTQLDWYGSYLDRATFQWNLIGECFMGQHIGGNRAPKNLTLHHNLYANLGSRTPLMQHADIFDFRNNVIYNWNGNNASVFGQFALNSSAFGNVVNNLWIAGPEGGYPYINVGNGGSTRIDGTKADSGGTKLYLAGNWGPRCPTGCSNDWTGHGVNTWDYYEFKHDGDTHLVDEEQYAAKIPFPAPEVTLDPVAGLLEKVLGAVGASKPSRDPIDLRIINSAREKNGTSRVAGTGPWPDLATGAPAPPADSDHDGMPDEWEKAHHLNPQDPQDGKSTAKNGYTNLENYLNELAGDKIP